MPPDSELESPTFIKKICKQTDRSKAFFSMTCEREVSDNTSDVEYKLKGFTFLINRWDFIFFFYIHTDEAQLVSKCCGSVAYFLHFRN